jgi:preprotein translocase subunit SecD
VNRSLKWRALLVAAAIIAALIYIYPSLSPGLPSWWTKALPSQAINLGLDLKGGMHLILEVQADKAVESAVERNIEELKFALRKDQIPVNMVSRVENNRVELQLARAEDRDKVNTLLDREFEYFVTESTSEESGRLTITLRLDDREAKRIKDMAMRQALETIRNRIDEFGVTEPDIRPQGDDRIVIQLPGIDDPERAKKLIGKTALLEFKLLDESRAPQAALTDGLPPGTEIAYEVIVDQQSGRERKVPYLLRKRTLMTGEYITDARVSLDNQFNTPYVSLSFDSKGARLFERITEANVHKRLAIVLDGNVYSAPEIQEKIGGGRAQITGRFTMEEARDLAIALRAGALPAPVEILEERTVGPSLGQDSIEQGINSIIVGLILVLAFMVIYYRVSGVIADVAVILNVLLIMGALAAFRATLTLPGIAGIILTIGMSVDANVLIFERIREEIRLGKSPRAAVDGGFGKAMLTILDANVTTLIAALVLFQFGTGPIRGFAVTLSVGIVASLFTAIFVSRLIFDYLLVQLKMRQVSV